MTLCCAGGVIIGFVGIALGIISLYVEDAKGEYLAFSGGTSISAYRLL